MDLIKTGGGYESLQSAAHDVLFEIYLQTE